VVTGPRPLNPARRRCGAAWASGALGVLGAAGGSGCASVWQPPQTVAARAVPPGQAGLRPDRVEWPAVPHLPLTEAAQARHCGPQALATLLQPLGLPTGPDGRPLDGPAALARLTPAVYLPARGGSLQAEMLAAARRSGAFAVALPGQITALMDELAAGHPVLVLQNLGLNWGESLGVMPWARWHYAVLVGYDRPAGIWMLRSGNEARQVLPWETFEYTWARAGHWAMAARRPGELPAVVTEPAAVEGALGLQRAAGVMPALAAWQAVLTRWPHNLTAAIGLGQCQYASGEVEAAALTWAAAARQHDSAVAWNNLAQLEWQRQRPAAARAALARAWHRVRTVEPQWRDAVQRTEAGMVAVPDAR
jgi:hypothetical protein